MFHSHSSIFKIFLILPVLLLLISSCSDDSSTTDINTDPRLTISTNFLDFGGERDAMYFIIRNGGLGSFDWTAVPQNDWLIVNPTSGSIGAELDTVFVRINKSGLDQGEYSGEIRVTPTVGLAQTVVVMMEVVVPDAIMDLSTNVMRFDPDETDHTFVISNHGYGTLDWTANADQDWMTVAPATGQTEHGTLDTLTVTVNRGDMAMGEYTGRVSVSPNFGNHEIIDVTLIVPPADPALDLSKNSLDFGDVDEQLNFHISNVGDQTLEWNIIDDANWITVEPTNGTTTTEMDEIMVMIDRTNLNAGTHTGEISIIPNFGNTRTIAVEMIVPDPELSVNENSLTYQPDQSTKTFEITNPGGAILDWQISVQPANNNWLSVNPANGQTTEEQDLITVSVNRNGLNYGAFQGTVVITSNGGNHTINVTMHNGEMIWSYSIVDDADLDTYWDCYDDDGFNGEDFWGVETYDTDDVVWCSGRGNLDFVDEQYDMNMEAWMKLRPNEAIDIESHRDIVVKFDLAYQTEAPQDYVRMLILGSDDSWHFDPNMTEWKGGDFAWKTHRIHLNIFDLAPDDMLQFGFLFHSDFDTADRGAVVKNIEIWGAPR